MKTSWILFLSLLLSGFTAWSQDGTDKDNSRIEALRAQFLTQELDLSPGEAQKFWPLYNQYREELSKIQNDRIDDLGPSRHRGKRVSDLSEKEADRLIKAEMQRQRSLLELREKYYELFKTALPITKIALLYQAEMEFKKRLIHRLSERRKN